MNGATTMHARTAIPADRQPRDAIATRLRRLGVRGTLRKAFADHVFAQSESIVMEIDFDRGGFGTAAGALETVNARTPADLPVLGPYLAPRRPAFAAMLAAGKIATFAVVDGEAVGCTWGALSDHRDTASREFYPVDAGEAYCFCFLVDPAFRRRNVALPLYRAMIVWLRTLGVARARVVIDRTNRVSYLIQCRFGGREIGQRVRHFHLFGRRWTRMSRYQGALGLVADAR